MTYGEYGYFHYFPIDLWHIGLALMIASVAFKVLWLSAWVYGLVYTFHFSRHWTPPYSSSRTIMQAQAYRDLPEEVSFCEGRRPRYCPLGCEWTGPDGLSGIKDITDRVYHCRLLKRCLPCYDHFCELLRVCVYSHTTKAYFNLIFWLMVDCLLTTGVFVFSVTTGYIRTNALLQATFVLVTVIILFLASVTKHGQCRDMVWRNSLDSERTVCTVY